MTQGKAQGWHRGHEHEQARIPPWWRREDAAVMPSHRYVRGVELTDVPSDGRKHFALVYFGETEDAKMGAMARGSLGRR